MVHTLAGAAGAVGAAGAWFLRTVYPSHAELSRVKRSKVNAI